MLMSSLGTVVGPQDRSSERYALIGRLFEIAKEVFPEICLKVLEANSSFQAQAWVLRGKKKVTLLGGLAFHPRLGKDGLLFTVLHEIGHHVAPGPRLTQTSPLSCDCAADRWVITEGQRLFSAHGITLDIQSALVEIESILCDLVSAEALDSTSWCFDWPRRKIRLSSVPAPQLTECEFRSFHR